jgi:hypothetical protein
VRQVGDRHEQRGALLLHLIELDLELTDLLRARLVRGEDRRRILAPPLRARDFVTRGVLVALQPLELRDQAAAAVLERRELLELRIRLQTAMHEAGPDDFHVLTHVRGVEHG